MKRPGHKLADIVDVARLQRLCDDYVEAGGMSLAVLDPDGTVLVASGWQDICTQYHRRNGTTRAGCIESDLRINERVVAGLEAPGHVACRCANGLREVAFPLVIEGEHLADLFTGQFFYDDDVIDIDEFRRRARELGFDERAHIEALGRVPVVTHERVERTIRFIADLVGMLGDLGVAAIRRDKDHEILSASQVALEEAQAMARLGRWELDLVRDRLEWSSGIFDLFEVDQREFTASYEAFLAAIHPDDRAAVDDAYAKSLKDRRPYEIVHRLLMTDGRVKWVHEQCRTEYAPDGTPLRSYGVVQDITAQRAAEEALRESREILRAVIDTIPARVFWKDNDLTYLGCNAPFARDAGFENTEDLVGKDDYAMGWREQADLYRADDRLVIDSGEPRLLVEEPQTTPAGEKIELLTSKVPLKNARDEVVGVLGTYLDITESRRAERALRQSDELLRGLFDTMPSGAAIYEVRGDGSRGSDYVVRDFNATSLRLEGKTKEEVVGRSLFELRPTIDEYGLIPVFQRVWQTGEPALFPSSLYVDEHFTNWYENHVFRLPSGEIVAIYDDVTERLQAEEAAAESADNYLRLFDASLNGMAHCEMVLDEQGRPVDYRFLRVNDAFEAQTELKKEDVEGRTIREIIPGFEKSAFDFIGVHGKVALTGEETEFEQYQEHLRRWYSVHLYSPRKGQFISMFSDITERKEIEQSIRRLNDELELRVLARTAALEAVNRELKSFAYSVSHDLRAPLRALDGFSEILLQDHSETLDDSGRDCLRRIKGAANHMAALIDGLLQLSRLSREDLVLERIDLSAMSAAIVDDLRDGEAPRDVDVSIADGLVAQADARLTGIMLENLLGNAWKFTSRRETARIVVGTVQTDAGRAFFVRDDGAGFDMRYAGNLFGAFQRLHTPDEFEGTGIGLATVQRIVNRHGGTVWAEGEVDKGATFWFTLGAPGAG